MKRIILILSLLIILISCATTKKDSLVAAIAWRDDDNSIKYQRLVRYLEDNGFSVVMLPKTTTPDLLYVDGNLSDDLLNYDFSLSDENAKILKNTDSIDVHADIKNIDLVVFSGGEDISPTLYRDDYEPSFDYIYNAERDASDYLLMRYVIENDIPAFAICRGMQVLAIASGLALIDDIPSLYPDLESVHRKDDGDYSFHEITKADGTMIDEVASAHHQAIGFREECNLEVTERNGAIIEGIKRTDKHLILGVQYHPEYYSDHKNMKGYDYAYKLLEMIKQSL